MAIFTVTMNAVAVSAAQDLFSLKVGATYPILIHEIVLGQKTLTAVEGKQLEFHRLTATVTQGSGGTSATPTLNSPGSGSTGVTARINDTSSATTNGTDTVVRTDVWMFVNGFFYLPAPEDRLYIPINSGFTVKLATAPSGSMTVSGSLVYEELGV